MYLRWSKPKSLLEFQNVFWVKQVKNNCYWCIKRIIFIKFLRIAGSIISSYVFISPSGTTLFYNSTELPVWSNYICDSLPLVNQTYKQSSWKRVRHLVLYKTCTDIACKIPFSRGSNPRNESNICEITTVIWHRDTTPEFAFL